MPEEVNVEVEPQRGPVSVEVPVKVAAECPGKPPGISHGGAFIVEHEAALVVVPGVQLVEGHLPQLVALLRAHLAVVTTLVGHEKLERVGPDGDLLKGCHDGGVILEVLNHDKLNAQIPMCTFNFVPVSPEIQTVGHLPQLRMAPWHP